MPSFFNDLGFVGGQKRRERDFSVEEGNDEDVITVGQAGLAWRREKRRAKLSVRVLRQLLSVVHALAGKHSTFPKGPLSYLVDNTQETTIGDQQDQPEEENKKPDSTPATTITTAEGDTEAMEEGEELEEERTTADLESVCSEAPRMAELEIKIQQTLDEIVKVYIISLSIVEFF